MADTEVRSKSKRMACGGMVSIEIEIQLKVYISSKTHKAEDAPTV